MKSPATVTIGIVGPYCDIPHLIFNNSLVGNYSTSFKVHNDSGINYYGNWGNLFFNDAAVVTAVSIINNSSDVLPGVHVNIKRFSDCGSWYTNIPDFTGNPNGFASSAMTNDIINVHKDVLGLVGVEYSSALISSGQQFSASQIPYCSTMSGSPRFSDKNRYPYVWRTFSSVDYTDPLFQLLNAWNVTRIAFIYQSNSDLGVQMMKTMYPKLSNQGINIVANIKVSYPVSTSSMQSAKQILDRLSARYIFLLGGSTFVYEALSFGGRVGLADADHVFLSFSYPVPGSRVLPEYSDAVRGFICFRQIASNSTTPYAKKTEKTIENMEGKELSYYDFWRKFEVQFAFDCAMMLMIGFDKTMKLADFNQLESRQLNIHLNFTHFQNLSIATLPESCLMWFVDYTGLTSEKMVLSSSGDLLTTTIAYYYTNDSAIAFGEMDDSNKFRFYYGIQPVFYGGTAQPPADGTIFLVEHDPGVSGTTKVVTFILSLCGILLSLSLLISFLTYSKVKVVKKTSLTESLAIIFGCLAGFCSCSVGLLDQTILLCHLRTWLFNFGYFAVFIAAISKTLILVQIFRKHSLKTFKANHFRIKLLQISSIVVVMTILALLSALGGKKIQKIIIGGQFAYECANSSSIGTMISNILEGLQIFFIFLLLPILYLSHQVTRHEFRQDSALAILFVISASNYIIDSYLESSAIEDLDTGVKVALSRWFFFMAVLMTYFFGVIYDLVDYNRQYATFVIHSKHSTHEGLRSKLNPSAGGIPSRVTRTNEIEFKSNEAVVFRDLKSELGEVPYQVQGLLGKTKWKVGFIGINYFSGKAWISLISPSSCQAFACTAKPAIETNNNQVIISHVNYAGARVKLVLERSSCDEANSTSMALAQCFEL